MRLDTPFPDTPLGELVLKIHFGVGALEESFDRSPYVLGEFEQSDGIALGRFIADLYLSLELAISTPLYEGHGIISNWKSAKALRTDANSNVCGRLITNRRRELGI